jgi:hypothetical protein
MEVDGRVVLLDGVGYSLTFLVSNNQYLPTCVMIRNDTHSVMADTRKQRKR